MGQNSQIYQIINNLSTDEDIRQELWVHYLTVQSTSNLSQHLEKLKIEYHVDRQIQDLLFSISKSSSNQQLSQIMSKFSDFESQLVILMMLGLSLEEISKIKGIQEVRIRQAIANIRYNEVWSSYTYGTKEESN